MNLQKGLDQALATKTADEELLRESLRLFEYVTFHDGRYRQLENDEWQSQVVELEKKICTRLGVKRYASIGVKQS